MIEAARKVGVHFSVQTVYNHERRAVKVVAGDVVEAHHKAAALPSITLPPSTPADADHHHRERLPEGSQLHEHFPLGRAGLKDGGRYSG